MKLSKTQLLESNLERKINKIALEKEESRKIVKEIINFGVTEEQKIDIMYFIGMTIEDNLLMKEITNFLQKHKSSINNEEKNVNNKKKIIT